eukprot:6941693-Karenia_brevis.AAC.1
MAKRFRKFILSRRFFQTLRQQRLHRHISCHRTPSLKEEKEELKDESGGALAPSAPPKEKTSKMPSASVATLPSSVKED